MLLPAFTLHRPTTVGEVLAVLAEHDETAIYMGGTELLLLMKLGMARPEHLVDCKRVSGLDALTVRRDEIRVGAAVTHRRVERDPGVAGALPALVEMTRQVANVRVRNAGTLAGNICFAEPHSDPATLLLALDARVVLAGASGSRELPLEQFVHGPLQTALRDGELMTEIVIPVPPFGASVVYRRLAVKERPAANVAVVVGGPAGTTRVVIGAAGPKPVRAAAAEAHLEAGEPDGRTATVRHALAEVNAYDDGDGSAEYKTHVAGVLLERALRSVGTR